MRGCENKLNNKINKTKIINDNWIRFCSFFLHHQHNSFWTGRIEFWIPYLPDIKWMNKQYFLNCEEVHFLVEDRKNKQSRYYEWIAWCFFPVFCCCCWTDQIANENHTIIFRMSQWPRILYKHACCACSPYRPKKKKNKQNISDTQSPATPEKYLN